MLNTKLNAFIKQMLYSKLMLIIQMLIAKLYVKYKVKCFYKANVIFKVDCTKLILIEHVVLNGFYTKHSNVILIHIYLYN